MKTTAIIPVKRFSEAKQRLGQAAGRRAKRVLVRAMLGDVLDAVGECSEIDQVLLVASEKDIPPSNTTWKRIADSPSGGDHSTAALRGIRRAMQAGCETVILLPGDCPLLDPAELTGALRRSHPGRVGIVPDRHGSGTNALILNPPNAIEPAFGPGSRERHERLAKQATVLPVIERMFSLALDVDTPDDLAALRQTLERDPTSAPRTAVALERLRNR